MKTQNQSPVYFIGHGSPMNAILENNYTHWLKSLAHELSVYSEILVISAHWETTRPSIQAQLNPSTIHDFHGFPKELTDIEFRFSSSLELNSKIQNLADVTLAKDWGWDHGVWSVLRHLITNPKTQISQLSLAQSFTWQDHIHLAQSLKSLRNENVLIIGSGNIVHNLRELNWSSPESGFLWASEFDELISRELENLKAPSELIDKIKQHPYFKMAVPTDEHFLPFLYCWALGHPQKPDIVFKEMSMGSLSMTSYRWG